MKLKRYKRYICKDCGNVVLLPVGYSREDTIEKTFEDIVCKCSGKTKEDFSSDYFNYFDSVFIKFKKGKYI